MFKTVEGGVCAAKGFKAAGIYCGIKENKSGKFDLGIVAADVLCNAAGVYTQNKVKGAPIIVTKKHLAAMGGKTRAIIVNSKIANTCNADGEFKAEEMCRLTAEALGIKAEEVIVASTGVIGQPLPIEPVAKAMPELVKKLSYTGNGDAEYAMMTTDTVKKEYAVEFTVGGKICKIGGMAKGSCMIHPNMATTLNFITTDAAVSSEMLQRAIDKNVKLTYNCMSIDGDTSTNDTLCILASGLAGNAEITNESDDYETFCNALFEVMRALAKMLAKDGEGATKLLECTVFGADSVDTAIIVAKSVIRSPLLKCAMFGGDANWGRILCAIGYAEADFDINKVAVDISSKAGCVAVCRKGSGVEFSEEKAAAILAEDEITISADLGCGNASATAWGCDLTYDYVKINGDYRS